MRVETDSAAVYVVNITTTDPLDDMLARQWRQGYYASVRYTDEMIGRVLGGLATSGRADETVVVIHGDHGWQVSRMSHAVIV